MAGNSKGIEFRPLSPLRKSWIRQYLVSNVTITAGQAFFCLGGTGLVTYSHMPSPLSRQALTDGS